MTTNNIDEILTYITELINEEQNSHSELLADLKSRIGNTKEFENVSDILSKIYEAKIEILEKIYRKAQTL